MKRHLFGIAIKYIVSCMCLVAFQQAVAQGTSGSIVGRIMDSSGAVVVGADITAVNHDTHIYFTGHSDDTGSYVILHVTPGVYTVTASQSGFGASIVPSASLVIDQKLLIDFKLKPGAVAVATTVTTEPSLLQTQSSETGAVIETKDILDLPLEGRNFFDLTLLVPGTVQVGGSINTFAMSVNGQREFANSIQVDGVESTTNRTQDITVTPSVDSVQEFKVATSSYNAEFGNAGGGIVSIQTKSGANAFHGDVYEFFRPNFTAARQYSFAETSQPSILKQHNYGATLGGPIRKDKAFFFVSFEKIKQSSSYNYLDSTVPMSQVKFLADGSADLSGMIDPSTGTVVPIFDPNVTAANCGGYCGSYSVKQFAGNVIPANRISPAGKSILQNFFPKPNLPGTGNGWFNNYAVNSPTSKGGLYVDSRYDQKLTEKDQVFAVYHYSGSNSLVTDPYHGNTVIPGAGDADQANNQDSQSYSVSLTETHILNPRMLNEARFGYTNYSLAQYSLLNGQDLSTKYGVGNITVPGFPATVGFPYIYMGSGYLTGGSTYKPYFVKDSNYQISNNFTASQVGRHELKFGGNFRRLNSHPNFSLFPTGFQYYGSYGYSMTADPSYGTIIPGAFFWAGGTDIADLLLGLPFSVDMGLQLTKPHTQSWEMSYYAQDTFRVTPRLTLNYGLRWDYQNPYTEANNNQSNFDLKSGNILVAGRGGNSASLMSANKRNFGPRFGFAYQINDKTVLRGGYGVNYSPENDGREDFLTKNAPFANQTVFNNYNALYSGSPSWNYQLDAGVPRSTTINVPSNGSINPSSLANGSLETTYYVDPNMKTGMSQMFNVTLQRQIGSSLSLETAYVGSVGHGLSYQIGNINENNAVTSNLGVIQTLASYGFEKYNSLQMKLTKRASRNLSFLTSYTYGHGIDNGPAPFNAGHINNDAPQNPYNLRGEVGSSDSDVRHNFVFSGLYKLPIGRGQAFFSNWGPKTELLLGGWQINSIYNMRTGTPINVVRGGDPTGSYTGLRPNIVGDPNLPRGKRTLTEWFNTAAFSTTGLSGTQPGNAGRNLFSGPGYINVAFSLFKEFSVDKYKLQTRLEAFNALNTPHFSNPDGNFSDGSFGAIRYTDGNSRVVQIAAKFMF